MNIQILPLTNDPNQTFQTTMEVNGKNLTLKFNVRYNEIADYWVMTVMDSQNNILLDSIPLITGVYPAADLLAQYAHLLLGSATIVNNGNAQMDYPDNTTLGKDFLLAWGDTV